MGYWSDEAGYNPIASAGTDERLKRRDNGRLVSAGQVHGDVYDPRRHGASRAVYGAKCVDVYRGGTVIYGVFLHIKTCHYGTPYRGGRGFKVLPGGFAMRVSYARAKCFHTIIS
jgi:hypothetical protein